MFDAIVRAHRKRLVRKGVARLKELTVADYMTKYIISVRPDETVIKAATKMIAEDISCLVVMEGEKLLGIFSERDFLMKVPLDKKVFGMQVTKIMTPNVVTVKPTMTLPDAVALMKEKNFRRLVVAENGKVLGIITQTDFSRALNDCFPAHPVSPALAVDATMTPKVLTATPKESFAHARDKMRKINVGCILIMDKGVPLGIFTEYDVVMQFYDKQGRLDIRELSAFMHKYVRVAPKGMNLFDANRLMLAKKMRRLPIVDGEKIAGIITQTDVVRYLYTHLDKVLAAEECKAPQRSFEGEFRGEHLKVY